MLLTSSEFTKKITFVVVATAFAPNEVTLNLRCLTFTVLELPRPSGRHSFGRAQLHPSLQPRHQAPMPLIKSHFKPAVYPSLSAIRTFVELQLFPSLCSSTSSLHTMSVVERPRLTTPSPSFLEVSELASTCTVAIGKHSWCCFTLARCKWLQCIRASKFPTTVRPLARATV